ncbi:MAG: ATP-binding protein [Nitrospirota bacterium]
MAGARRSFWKQLRVQQKLGTILLVVFAPLLCALIVHIYLLNQLHALQQERHQVLLAREQVQVLRRLAADVEDAFRGYLLTRQDTFLQPLLDAEPSVQPTIDRIMTLIKSSPELEDDVRGAGDRLASLLESKQALIRHIRSSGPEGAAAYVRSGRGIILSDAVRNDLRTIEDVLDGKLNAFEADEAKLIGLDFGSLVLAVTGTLALGLLHARLLSRCITGPIVRLQESVAKLSGTFAPKGDARRGADRSPDEIDQLAQAFDELTGRLRLYMRELEAINAIGHEINTIRADGLHGMLRRITDRAVELLQADVCLVMLRNEEMGCWVIEAASGEWSDVLQKAVMLWEEFPVSVQAFETRQPAFGEDLRSDLRPEVRRRNLIGQSMLSIPLLSQGEPFGVLVLLQDRPVPSEEWNLRSAKSFADEAAVAIANARLYEAVQRKGVGLESRLKQLEHLAETLAHDMKGPGERMGELATNLLDEYGDRLDDRAERWLRMMAEEGKDLSTRIENILEVARLGVRPETLEAVAPAMVLDDVLKQRAGELERQRIRVRVEGSLPLVACHQAYLRQVLDNLVSNAVKFSDHLPESEIRIAAKREGPLAYFSISDNGPGIPAQYRERVFEPFARLNTGTVKGSGIGLTIVKRIVEMYGGRVWIEPQGPPGCTVTFSLPLLVDRSVTLPAGAASDQLLDHAT